jgi:FMN phosphatase YigB (HAD superfamily)
MYGRRHVMERIEVVLVSCEQTVINLQDGVEAVLYRTARRHGEAPLDRGRALRRQLEALSAPSLAAAYEALADDRGYRWAGPGELAVAAAGAASGHYPDVAPALERARAAGLQVVATADADRRLVEAALRPLDGAFDAVIAGCGLSTAIRSIGISGRRIVHVAARGTALRAAAALGIRSVWLNRRAAPPRRDAPYDFEWRTLEGLSAWLASAYPVGAGR